MIGTVEHSPATSRLPASRSIKPVMGAIEHSVDHGFLFTALPTPFLVLTPELVIWDANDAWLRALRVERQDLIGRHMFDVFPDTPDAPEMSRTRENVRASLERVSSSGQAEPMPIQKYDVEVPGTDGREFEEHYWRPVNTPICAPDGEVLLVVHRVDDVTEAHRAQARLQASERRFRALVEPASDIILIVGAARELVYISPALRRMLPYEPEALGFARWGDMAHPDDRPAAGDLFAQARSAPAGETYRGRLRTGLPNRRWFLEAVKGAAARAKRTGGSLGLVLVDVDHFKLVNDSLGHPAGDRLLCELADRMAGALRPSDRVARLGGDEFAALAEDLRQEGDAFALAQRVAAAGSGQYRPDSALEIRATVSAGVSTSTGETDPVTLLAHADAALYEAKREGRDRIQAFDPELRRHVVHRVRLQHELRHSVDADELVLHWQPIVAVKTAPCWERRHWCAGSTRSADSCARPSSCTSRTAPP